jgi:hypothetical protein
MGKQGVASLTMLLALHSGDEAESIQSYNLVSPETTDSILKYAHVIYTLQAQLARELYYKHVNSSTVVPWTNCILHVGGFLH